MNLDKSYKIAFSMAFGLHILIMVCMAIHNNVKPESIKLEAKVSEQNNIKPQPEIIKAVSVDQQEVTNTVNRIKEQRLKQEHAEKTRQRQLENQAEQARLKRLQEQKRLNALRQDEIRIAKAREKKLADEQKRLNDVAKRKREHENKLAELKKRQDEESKKLEAIRQKKIEAEKKAAEEERQKRLAKLKAEKAEREAEKAKIEARNQIRINGEVNKYKGLIISAISRQWIIPDYIDNKLSSQFRIQLAPNGKVLEVKLIRSSGDGVLDRSAQSAIYKASPLPVPSDPNAFKVFRDINLTVRPENARG